MTKVPRPTDPGAIVALQARLAVLFARGTRTGCVLVAVGLLLALAPATRTAGTTLVSLGVGVVIVLPIIGVCGAGLWFARRREWDFAAMSALILALIASAIVLGLHRT